MMTEDAPDIVDNPFDERAQRWIVQKFVILHTTGKITAKTTNTKYSRGVTSGGLTSLGAGFLTYEDADERFKDLLELERKYRGEIKVSRREWKKVEQDLYPLVMLLVTERRIGGAFELPLQDLVKFKDLEARFTKLEQRVDELDFGSPNPTRGRGQRTDEQ